MTRRVATLLVHGAGGGAWEFRKYVPRLAARRLGPTALNLQLHTHLGPPEAVTLHDYKDQLQRGAAKVLHSDEPTERRQLAIVGASMGATLALLVAPTLKPDAIVLVNAALPPAYCARSPASTASIPPIKRWAGSSIERTARAMPDATMAMCAYASRRWRDESGAVLRALRTWEAPPRPDCPVLFVVGGADEDMPAASQIAWAADWQASTRLYAGASHLGPLLGESAPQASRDVALWLEGVFRGSVGAP